MRGAQPIAAPRRIGMLSDGSLVGVPVARLSCRGCGTAWLPQRLARRLPIRLFGAGYTLNAAPPTRADEIRQQGHAERIARLCPLAGPASMLDIGCGNGALLLALGRLWPNARLAGVEPAPGAAASARAAGLSVAPALMPGHLAELVVSVNVIEHVADPLAFLRALRRAVVPGGAAVVICPDGTTPWLELLMSDHRWSFTPDALATLARQAGFAVVAVEPARAGFQAIVMRPAALHLGQPRRRVSQPGLAAARRHYMASWRRLDAVLTSRGTAGRRLICFGVGETARLLRAYAPRTWQRVAAVTADDPKEAAQGASALGKPMVALEEVGLMTDEVLLAVRPQAQAALAARLAASSYRVLYWQDLVAA